MGNTFHASVLHQYRAIWIDWTSDTPNATTHYSAASIGRYLGNVRLLDKL